MDDQTKTAVRPLGPPPEGYRVRYRTRESMLADRPAEGQTEIVSADPERGLARNPKHNPKPSRHE